MSNMKEKKYQFAHQATTVYFDAGFELLDKMVPADRLILVTDEHIYQKQQERFKGRKVIVIKPGEAYKNQRAVDDIIEKLIGLHADRQSFIVGVGGGVVTDMTGYAASVYMRGVRFGFVPSSVLAMVDAAIGGKNGVDVGVYKNLAGTINHPEFLLYDYSLLETLPEEEWINGFAEIIKHACIRDKGMFEELAKKNIAAYLSSKEETGRLIQQNAEIKFSIVRNDEREAGERKLLNFGHTIGHAIENTLQIPHGHAVSIGMVAACRVSEKANAFDPQQTERVAALLSDYALPVTTDLDKTHTWDILLHDKKKAGDHIHFVVLDAIGEASVKKIPLTEFKEIFNSL